MDDVEIKKFIDKYGKLNGPNNKFSLHHNFLGAYAIDEIQNVIDDMSNKQFPFLITNTSESHEKGQHWILLHLLKNMQLPALMLFDSFGKVSLETLFISDDKNILKKFISNLKPLTDKEGQFDFFRWEINCRDFLNLPKNDVDNLTPLCKGFFFAVCSLMKYYNKINNKKDFVINVFGLIDDIQSVNRTTCGAYCLYYIYNLFYPDANLELHKEKGDITTIKKLVNSIFVDEKSSLKDFNENVNELIIDEFIKQFGIKIDVQDKELLKQ